MPTLLDEKIPTPPTSPSVATPLGAGLHGRVTGVRHIGARAGLIAGGGLAAIVAAIFYGIGANGSHHAAPAAVVPQAITTTAPSIDQIPGALSTPMPVALRKNPQPALAAPIVLHAVPPPDSAPAAAAAVPLSAQAQNALTTVPAIAPMTSAAAAAATAPQPSPAEVARQQAAQQRLAAQQQAAQVALAARRSTIIVPMGTIAQPPNAAPAAPPSPAAPTVLTANASSSRYALLAGSVIPATLVSGINSDLPGTIVAQVSQAVYDSKSEHELLIPAGSKLIGQFDSNVVAGQSRVMVAWSRLIFPDSSSIDLGNLSAADAAGYAGITGDVDTHVHNSFLKTALTSLITLGSALVQPRVIELGTGAATVVAMPNTTAQMAVQGAGQAAQTLTTSNQSGTPRPTISVQPGTNFTVLVSHDLAFSGPYASSR